MITKRTKLSLQIFHGHAPSSKGQNSWRRSVRCLVKGLLRRCTGQLFWLWKAEHTRSVEAEHAAIVKDRALFCGNLPVPMEGDLAPIGVINLVTEVYKSGHLLVRELGASEPVTADRDRAAIVSALRRWGDLQIAAGFDQA